ncbi:MULTISPECIES: hypothetical protein [unclassified Variovorax]|uniref:hypothetical protein n=1 Tax=unclassified Variovorax TaxID=663243 RepID=UPI003ECE189D
MVVRCADARCRELRRPCGLPARDALALLGEDAMVVAVAAGNLGHGVVLSHKERQRLLACATRVRRIADQVDADARRRARRILPPARGRSRA